MSRKAKAPPKAADAPIPATIKESAHQIWSAGMDAITRAQQGGNRVFEALVREGESLRDNLQKKTRESTASVSEAASRATDTWDKLEQVFERRVARALSTLGVPTRSDISDLSKRVDVLSRLITRVNGSSNEGTPITAVRTKATTAKARGATSTATTASARKASAGVKPSSSAKPRRNSTAK